MSLDPLSPAPAAPPPDSRPASPPARESSSFLLGPLFSTTLFLSACLLFLIQPIIAKMIVPHLGGAPSVWNTCMVFFQAALLAGYGYAHFTGARFRLQPQAILHCSLLVLCGLILPFAISPGSLQSLAQGKHPGLWLLTCLTLTVGLPFFILATTAPLLQKWFSNTKHPSAADPYFLYAASNLGSLLALIGYPLAVEPFFRLRDQSDLWTAGYWVLAFLIALCAGGVTTIWRSPAHSACQAQIPAALPPVSPAQKGRWILFAFVPSSLMLGVTTYLTTDIASIPLLWVLPLALYLLTFVLAFAKRQLIPLPLLARIVPIGAVALVFLLLSEATHPTWLLILLHLAFFFLASLLAHARLAEQRPAASYLTQFYFWMSAGGVLGGLFNALLAPELFTLVIEYPALVVLACFLRPNPPQPANSPDGPTLASFSSIKGPVLVGLACLGLVLVIPRFLESSPLQRILVFGAPLLAVYFFVDHPRRFGLALAAVLLASSFHPGGHGQILHAERNFFGLVKVTRDPEAKFIQMIHGNTIHGRQSLDPTTRHNPLSYYHRTGPLGQIFKTFDSRPAHTNVALVGLGTGSMLAYARPHQHWTLFEINPAVIRLAKDPRFFTFLADSKASRMEFVLGDARLQLQQSPAHAFHLLILDAFSSDSIPIHLMTLEAFELYVSKLAPGGFLAFHISNRNLDLEPIVTALAHRLNLKALSHDEADPSTQELAEGKNQSHWLVLARFWEDLGSLKKDARWLPLVPQTAAAPPKVWMDDFSNILEAFKWR